MFFIAGLFCFKYCFEYLYLDRKGGPTDRCWMLRCQICSLAKTNFVAYLVTWYKLCKLSSRLLTPVYLNHRGPSAFYYRVDYSPPAVSSPGRH